MRGLTVTGGKSIQGGGILNSGTLVLRDVTISGNAALGNADGGGGLLNSGTATLTVYAWDGSTGSDGGKASVKSNAFSATALTATCLVNDAPTLTS